MAHLVCQELAYEASGFESGGSRSIRSPSFDDFMERYTFNRGLQAVQFEAITTSISATIFAGSIALLAYQAHHGETGEEIWTLDTEETASIIESDDVPDLLKSLAFTRARLWRLTGQEYREWDLADSRPMLLENNAFLNLFEGYYKPEDIVLPSCGVAQGFIHYLRSEIKSRNAAIKVYLEYAKHLTMDQGTSSGCPALHSRTTPSQPVSLMPPEHIRYLLESGMFGVEADRLVQIRDPFKLGQLIVGRTLRAFSRNRNIK